MNDSGEYEITEIVDEREIHLHLFDTGDGISVLLSGGDHAHIGAVTIAFVDSMKKMKLQTTVFPGHKENVITEEWARYLAEHYEENVVVAAGIHYDNISPEKIKKIVDCCDKLLKKHLICER